MRNEELNVTARMVIVNCQLSTVNSSFIIPNS